MRTDVLSLFFFLRWLQPSQFAGLSNGQTLPDHVVTSPMKNGNYASKMLLAGTAATKVRSNDHKGPTSYFCRLFSFELVPHCLVAARSFHLSLLVPLFHLVRLDVDEDFPVPFRCTVPCSSRNETFHKAHDSIDHFRELLLRVAIISRLFQGPSSNAPA